MTGKIALMVFETVIAGVLVYLGGQFIKVLFLDPLVRYKRVVGRIDNQLKYYANTITSPLYETEHGKQGARVMRELSSDLEEAYKALPAKKRLALMYRFFLGVPDRNNIASAATDLIFLHNSRGEYATPTENNSAMSHIREVLGIEELATAQHDHLEGRKDD